MKNNKVLKLVAICSFVAAMSLFIIYKLSIPIDKTVSNKSNKPANSNEMKNWFENHQNLNLIDVSPQLTEKQLEDSIQELKVIMSTSKSVAPTLKGDTLSVILSQMQYYLKLKRDSVANINNGKSD